MRNRLCMFPNLKAEQARAHMTNQDVADVLKITRVTYETKKKSGRFGSMKPNSFAICSSVSSIIFLLHLKNWILLERGVSEC